MTNNFEYLNAALDILPKTASSKLVLIMLAKHRNHKTGLCCPSLDSLIDSTGLAKRTVLQALKDLKESGIVTWKRGKRGNRYANGIPNLYALDLAEMKASRVLYRHEKDEIEHARNAPSKIGTKDSRRCKGEARRCNSTGGRRCGIAPLTFNNNLEVENRGLLEVEAENWWAARIVAERRLTTRKGGPRA